MHFLDMFLHSKTASLSTMGPDTVHGRFLMEELVFATCKKKNIYIYIYKAIANFNINSKFWLFSLLILNLRFGILFI